MVYNFVDDNLECPNCGSKGNPDIHADDKNNIEICPICGGELGLGKYGSARKCGYCDSYMVCSQRTTGQYTPAAIIPSTMTKKDMFRLLTEKFSKYMCLIPEIFSETRLKEVIIEYVPYWVYAFGIRASFHGDIKTRTELGNRTRIDTYRVDKTVDLKMGTVPVDASDRMPDSIMDDLEPFDFKKAIPFKNEYLSGSNSEIYNHDSSDYKEEASIKASSKTYEYIEDDISKSFSNMDFISSQSIRDNTSLNITTLQSDYLLLPVYRYSYTLHSGKVLDYYVNGQTHEVYGKVPISGRKLATACAATVTAFLGAAAIITTILVIVGGAV